MNALAKRSARAIALAIAVWIAAVAIAWQLTSGGQQAIDYLQCRIDYGGTCDLVVNRKLVHLVAIVASLLAVIPPVLLITIWVVARRRARRAAA